ncbi:E3 SUMO-protein ligase ZBED1-like [Haliotis asinina]|uniref:E3 SUMO-protein ligase ZBED1-like n=1 Tax=Haliotis asinina TaxID=109174 RepID=UPI003532249B
MEEPPGCERHNGMLLKSFWGRSISHVWDYFKFEVTEAGTKYVDKKSMYCMLCGLKMRYCGNTTNMSNHLDRKHPGVRNQTPRRSMVYIDDAADNAVIKQEEGENVIISNFVDCQNAASTNAGNSGGARMDGEEESADGIRILKSFWQEGADDVWEYFKFEVDDDGNYLDVAVVYCTLCDCRLEFKEDTANLHSHIVNQHPGVRHVNPSMLEDESLMTLEKKQDLVKRLAEKCRREICAKTDSNTRSDEAKNTSVKKYFRKFWGHTTSNVWEHFRFEADKDGNYIDRTIMYCMLCNTQLRYCHNTTNMAYHLEKRHQIQKKPFLNVKYFNLSAVSDQKSNMKKVVERKLGSVCVKKTPIYAETFTRNQSEGEVIYEPPSFYKAFWGNATSPVWEHFKFEVDSQGNYVDKTSAYCTLCGLKMKYFQNTSNLSQHLKRKHVEECFSSVVQMDLSDSNSTTFSKPTSNCTKQDDITQAIARHFIADWKPLSNIESPSFQEMCMVMCPEYSLPDLEKFVEVVLAPMYRNKRSKVVKEVSQAVKHCLTTEIWRSDCGDSNLTVMVSFIDDAWAFRTDMIKTFPFSMETTPEDLSSSLLKIADDWNLKDPVVVTDGDHVILEAVSNCPSWHSICGLNHTVASAVNKAFSFPTVHMILSKVKNLFSQIKQVAPSVDITQKQKSLNVPEKDVYREFDDQWCSSIDMLQLYLEQEPVLKAVVGECHLYQDLLLSETSLEHLEKLVEILVVFNTAVAYLSPEKGHTLSVILPIVIKLKGSLHDASDDVELVKNVKAIMASVLEDNYGGTTIQEQMKVASALDPRMKKLAFLSVTEREEIWGRICKEARETADPNVVVKTEVDDGSYGDSTVGEPPAKVPRGDVSISDWLGDIVRVKSSLSVGQQIENELKLFHSEPDISFDDSPIHWWQRRCRTYPFLSALAKRYMCIPAISGDGELKQSDIRLRRARLDSETMDMQLFLHHSSNHSNA